MAFEGYLIKAINDKTKAETIMNNKWIVLESYKTTPNVREEIKAKRDDYSRNLTRVTATGTKTSITFSVPACGLATKKAVQKFFTDNEVDKLQRKIHLRYWNDEANDYRTGYFYRTDIEFTIKRINGNDILYAPFEITLVEY